MLTSKTLVQVRKSGASVPAGELQIGDVIYDRFAGRYREISDVLKRTVDTSASPELAPVPIRWGVFGRGVPARDVHVSPEQRILRICRPKNAIPFLESVSARDLDLTVLPHSPGHDTLVTYVALFFDGPCYVVCSDLLIFGYTPDIFVTEPQQLRRRVRA